MTMTCDQVRALLEEHGLEGLRTSDAARDHAADCEECFALVEAFGEVDRALAAMPAVAAPPALIERVLSAPKPAAAPRASRRWIYGGSAIAALLLVGLFSTTALQQSRSADRAPLGEPMISVQSQPVDTAIVVDGQASANGKLDADKPGYYAYSRQLEDTGKHTIVLVPEAPAPAQPVLTPPNNIPVSGDELGRDANEEITRGPRGYAAIVTKEQPDDGVRLNSVDDHLKDKEEPVHHAQPQGRFERQAEDAEHLPARDPSIELDNRYKQRALDRIEDTKIVAKGENKNAFDVTTKTGLSETVPQNGGAVGHEGTEVGNASPPQLLIDRDQIAGLSYQEAAGYWQNTYVPGDPAFRMLAAKLSAEGIEDQARQYDQPFDAPRNAALGVTMGSDRAAVDGETRVLLQVGLKGAPEYGRRRPAMNLALVVDASGAIDVETAKAIRSVVTSFAQHKEAGDRLALIAAGRPGAMLVEPKRFEYGTVAVAMQQLLGDRPAEGEALTVSEAMRRGIELVAGEGDESAPLGASAVVLIAHQTLGMETPQLSDMAHQSAVAGIVVSTIGVGNATVLPELDQIALSGQGNRRVLAQADEAEKLVDRELSAVSRVVARAVRLRIRLAPGVKLVNVLGSRRLDTMESTRVKEAEKSIDLRLSKSLGIEADRGEDEDGIQIVIPSYYANDEHPILLDVVVPGPGPVADVQVRYKDLVYLKNGVARARLELRRGHTARGPLQMAVLKNFVARRLSDDLADASRRVAIDDLGGARQTLSASTALLADLQRVLPQDRELARDAAMLSRYAQAIGAPDQTLVDSMQFASKAKILPAPPPSER